MTAQSKANIEACVDAKLVPDKSSAGYQVELVGETGKTAFVENSAGPISYSSMAAAKAAVRKHNSALKPTLKPTI
jgi:hypothetical protein